LIEETMTKMRPERPATAPIKALVRVELISLASAVAEGVALVDETETAWRVPRNVASTPHTGPDNNRMPTINTARHVFLILLEVSVKA
jgi:hypothetical protein